MPNSQRHHPIMGLGGSQKINKFKKLIRFTLTFSVLASLCIGSQALAGSTSKKVTKKSSINSRSVHKVPNNAPFDGNLDPRAETFFTDKVKSNSNEKWSFKANYYITSAKRTTVAQFLQSDPNQSGANKRKPVMFLTATKKSNGKYFICNGNSTNATSCKGAEWDNVPASFVLRMSGNGKSASVKINGSTKTLSLIKTPSGESRKNGTLELRWGAYHHDTDSGGARSTAQVRVYNVSETGFN